jgi:hypothetical protein
MTVTDEQPVEVIITRPNGGEDEIVIQITYPRTETTPKKCVYVTLTPHNFTMALTARGGIMGKACEYVYPLSKSK